MKRFPKWILMLSLLLVVFICLPGTVHAQPDPCRDPFDYCPIDGGLSTLLVIGVGYGIKKIGEARKALIDKEKS
ncbi:MAG: hypothetical protein M3Z26_08195 [Bacteroidota bacterium]|nr:hypothetical protein [Bacteroidota bacterium]